MNVETENYDAQFADDYFDDELEVTTDEFNNKRMMLETTKIVKQTWSITEIYQKIKSGDLILDPDYQRNEVWHISKQVSFIESLFMEIMIPPIYVVEVPSGDVLERKKYEVVDGKQRLSTINRFVKNELKLDRKYLEYYGDLYHGKSFNDLYEHYSEKVNQVLSSILDIYVITSNSPAETKYDIFARLNKGAEPLKVNEIRKAIYHSKVTDIIDTFIKEKLGDGDNISDSYLELFTKNDVKHFNDYGRFYRSIAFYYNTDLENCIVRGYNSRPKEMIDTLLQECQVNAERFKETEIIQVLERTISLLQIFKDNPNREYLIDACIPFSLTKWTDLTPLVSEINNNNDLNKTFEKSKATTSNVNKRVEIISQLLEGCKNGKSSGI
ncbi:DUF262 domain-containing protein [Veillonella atypica]|uniref:GmrSD restriction endonuclease domain-containing protein n=1 Tax=Veillonella atypica TaxID=39777 RepID=UPI0015BA7958